MAHFSSYLRRGNTNLPQYGHAAQVYGHRNSILFAAAAMCVGLLLW